MVETSSLLMTKVPVHPPTIAKIVAWVVLNLAYGTQLIFHKYVLGMVCGVHVTPFCEEYISTTCPNVHPVTGILNSTVAGFPEISLK